eukprot:Rhum_TRINITY_DN11236_c0_g1::Rhum_TRINITY_DN11236_c0_g1_i1::g.43201::m.43201
MAAADSSAAAAMAAAAADPPRPPSQPPTSAPAAAASATDTTAATASDDDDDEFDTAIDAALSRVELSRAELVRLPSRDLVRPLTDADVRALLRPLPHPSASGAGGPLLSGEPLRVQGSAAAPSAGPSQPSPWMVEQKRAGGGGDDDEEDCAAAVANVLAEEHVASVDERWAQTVSMFGAFMERSEAQDETVQADINDLLGM